jgi:hypothetical protein
MRAAAASGGGGGFDNNAVLEQASSCVCVGGGGDINTTHKFCSSPLPRCDSGCALEGGGRGSVLWEDCGHVTCEACLWADLRYASNDRSRFL